jgi:hypothetical protein
MNENIQLSVVVTARNDDHGQNFLYRMQHFVNGFIYQSNKYKLRSELVIVEWNPPDDKKLLSEVISFPTNNSQCDIRFIEVPATVHKKYRNSDKLHLYQMIGKNIGIRRAKGNFILATNIDILFSDELILFMRDKLTDGFLYRVDRYDVPGQLPVNCDFPKILEFCSKNYFRINGKWGTLSLVNKKWVNLNRNNAFLVLYKRLIAVKLKNINIKSIFKVFNKIKFIFLKYINKKHTNACGDFTLLSRNDWEKIGGYLELPIYSWHIDSVLLYYAMSNKIKELDLSKMFRIYHIDHSISSGYTHENPNALFDRLNKLGIPFLSNQDLDEYFKESLDKRCCNYNENWGLRSFQLNENMYPVNL